MISAMLMNPSTRKASRVGKGRKRKAAKRSSKMSKRRTPPRNKRGQFRKRKGTKRRNPTVKAAKRRKQSKVLTRKGPRSRTASAAAKKGWRRRKASKKNWSKTRKRKGSKRFARNPFAIGGRRGKFNLVPDTKAIKAAATKGAGAVFSEILKSTVYSSVLAKFRPLGPTSVAEDTLARLASGAVAGALAGYLGGAKMASDVVEGTYTVALYKLVADVFARATNGKAKLFGFVANPFTAVPTMPIIPALSMSGAAAPAGVGMLGGVVPEGNVLPLGGVVPEGNVIPIGQDYDELPDRFRARF